MPSPQRRAGALSAPELQQLAAVSPEVEWFANLRSPNTRKAYQADIRDFSAFIIVHL